MALTRIKTDSITANAITTEKISSSVNFGLRNKIINGDMKIAQRNTTGSLGNSLAYVSLDRWGGYNSVTSANITLSQVAFTPGQTDVPGATHYLSLQDVGAPLSATRYVAHRIEDVTTLAGQTATLSEEREHLILQQLYSKILAAADLLQ
jgi:hypothetical protein